MTFPAVASVTRGASINDVNTRSVALPSVVNAGDLLLALFVNDGSAAVAWDQASAGQWTLLHSSAAVPAGEQWATRLTAYWKIAAGDEGGRVLSIYTNAAETSVWQIYRITGGDQIVCANAVTDQDWTYYPDPPSLTTGWGAADALWIAAIAISGVEGGSYIHTVNAPAAYSAHAIYDHYDGAGGSGIASSHRTANAASENPAAWTAADDWQTVSQTYAIRRAAQTIAAPRLDVGVSFFAPTLDVGGVTLTPPRLDIGVNFPPPLVANVRILTPARLDVGIALSAPQIVTDNVSPPRLDIQLALFAPAVIPGGLTLSPPLLAIGVEFPRPTVLGGARTIPHFTHLAIGGGAVDGVAWDSMAASWSDVDESWEHLALGPAAGVFPGIYGDLALYSSAAPGATFASRWAIRGPIGFADFQPFIAGDYLFERAAIWLKLTAPQPFLQELTITQARINVDVPDVIDSGEVAVPIGGAWFTFNRAFYEAPKVNATFRGGSTLAVVKVTTIERTRFFVILEASADPGTSVAGDITYSAIGY